MSAVARGWTLIAAIVAATVGLVVVLSALVVPTSDPDEGVLVPVPGLLRDVVDLETSLAFLTGDGAVLVDPETLDERARIDLPGVETAAVSADDRLVLVGPDVVETFDARGSRLWSWDRPAASGRTGVDVTAVAATEETTTLLVGTTYVGIGSDGEEVFRVPSQEPGGGAVPLVTPLAAARTPMLSTALADPGAPLADSGPRLLDADTGEVLQEWADGHVVLTAHGIAVRRGASMAVVEGDGTRGRTVALDHEPDLRHVIGSTAVYGAPANPFRTFDVTTGESAGPADLWDTIDEAPSRQTDTVSGRARDALVLVMSPGRDRRVGGVTADAGTWIADLAAGGEVTVGWRGIVVLEPDVHGAWPLRREVEDQVRLELLDPASGESRGVTRVRDVPGPVFVPRADLVVTVGGDVRVHRLDQAGERG